MIKIDRNLTDDEVKLVLFERSKSLAFDQDEIVLSVGDVCTHLYFIEKGMLRNFYYDKKGNDITHWFASEDMIMTIPPSFFKREPSIFGIEATEHTNVRAISYDQLEEAFTVSRKLERFGRLLATEIMMALGRKVIDLQTKSAEERHRELLETYPDIYQRAKLGHIAGYLGITQQSLSRIRARSK